MADVDQLLTGLVEELRREGATSHTRRIRLGDPDDAREVARTDAAADTCSTRCRIRRGDERIRAVVEVEERGLRTFVLFVYGVLALFLYGFRRASPKAP